LRFIFFLFARGDGAFAPDPHDGRIYAIKVTSHGGPWLLWVNRTDWVIDTSLSWVTWTVVAVL